jgi:hypothetical protein
VGPAGPVLPITANVVWTCDCVLPLNSNVIVRFPLPVIMYTSTISRFVRSAKYTFGGINSENALIT